METYYVSLATLVLFLTNPHPNFMCKTVNSEVTTTLSFRFDWSFRVALTLRHIDSKAFQCIIRSKFTNVEQKSFNHLKARFVQKFKCSKKLFAVIKKIQQNSWFFLLICLFLILITEFMKRIYDFRRFMLLMIFQEVSRLTNAHGGT